MDAEKEGSMASCQSGWRLVRGLERTATLGHWWFRVKGAVIPALLGTFAFVVAAIWRAPAKTTPVKAA